MTLLADISAYAYVWYFRCARCAHVWNMPKREPPLERVAANRTHPD